MCLLRVHVFGLLLFITLLFTNRVFAQDAQALPQQATFQSIVQLANQVSHLTNAKRPLPPTFQIDSGNGQIVSIYTSQALGLLAVATDMLRSGTATTATFALPPAQIGWPVDSGITRRTTSLYISTQQIIDAAHELVNFSAALGAYPSALWVEKDRLSATDLLVGFSTVLQFTAETGQLPSMVHLVPAIAPTSWRPPVEKQIGPSVQARIPPQPPTETSYVKVTKSKVTLNLLPEKITTKTGSIEVVAILQPADTTNATVSFLIDGRLCNQSNWPPFSMQVNMNKLSPGKHKLAVKAESADGVLLASKEISFTVANPIQTQIQQTSAKPSK
jgi:hypothetical protein